MYLPVLVGDLPGELLDGGEPGQVQLDAVVGGGGVAAELPGRVQAGQLRLAAGGVATTCTFGDLFLYIYIYINPTNIGVARGRRTLGGDA